jgi:hypothetical protein
MQDPRCPVSDTAQATAQPKRDYPSQRAIREAARPRGWEKPPGSCGNLRSRHREWVCLHCGRNFRGKVRDRVARNPELVRKYCGTACSAAAKSAAAAARRAAEDAGDEKRRRTADRKRAWRAESPARLARIAELQPLTPQQSAKLRGHIATAICLQVPQAHDVVMGTRQWTPTQARVFAMLLDKVLPDLSASYGLTETAATDVEQMSREALEAIAAGEGRWGDGAGREAVASKTAASES